MGEHKLADRTDILRAYIERTGRYMPSSARFIPVAAKPRLSKRGEVHPSWYTKRLTPSRIKDLFERLPHDNRGFRRTTLEDNPRCVSFIRRFPDCFKVDYDFVTFVPGGTNGSTVKLLLRDLARRERLRRNRRRKSGKGR